MAKYQCAMCNLTSEIERGDRADLHRTVNVLLNYVTTLLGVHAADVLIYDADTKILKYVSGRGFAAPAFENSSARAALAGQVVREGQLVRYADLRRVNNVGTHSRELTAEGFITYLGMPLVANAKLIGVLECFQRESLNPNGEWLQILEALAERGAHALGNALLFRHLQQANNGFVTTYDVLIDGWALALELRDSEPKGHTKRVTEMTMEFAHIMGVSAAELVNVRRGAMLHDVGKMGIPDSILLKKDSLTDDEWKIMRQHPVIAYEQLKDIEFLRPALAIPYSHHERWDGAGYPCGIAGEEIPFVARLFAIVDVWDSLFSDRPYRKAWPSDRVRSHLRDQGAKQFDPKLADLFVKLLENGDVVRRKGVASPPGALRNGYAETIIHV
jgi:HD-GYP domain-containing protein (c-di-GMP phosphodiesterase class II)